MRKIIFFAAMLLCSSAFSAENDNAADVAPVLYSQRNAILDQLTNAQVEINKLRADLEKAKAENKCADVKPK